MSQSSVTKLSIWSNDTCSTGFGLFDHVRFYIQTNNFSVGIPVFFKPRPSVYVFRGSKWYPCIHQNLLNCASRSPELPATTRLQWLQCNPLGKLWLSKLRPLKVFGVATDRLRLIFYMSDYIAETISTETDVVEVLRSIIFSVSRNSLAQGECSLFLPRLDGRNQQNIQPRLNKIHFCWHLLLVHFRLLSQTVTHVSTVIFLEQFTSRKTSD